MEIARYSYGQQQLFESRRELILNNYNDAPMDFQAQMNQTKLSERTIREIKLLAFEYVKQIVAKANELSQNKLSHVCDKSGVHGVSNINEQTQGSEFIEPVDKRLVLEAAIQINKQFRFPSGSVASRTPGSAANNSNNNSDARNTSNKTKSVTYQNHPTQAAYTKIISPHTTTTKNSIITRDYIEQDYATMSSSQDESEMIRGTDGSNGREVSFEASRANTSSSNQSRPGKFRGLHQRLNWHLLVSCFSTCLPETLTRTTRSNTGPSAV